MKAAVITVLLAAACMLQPASAQDSPAPQAADTLTSQNKSLFDRLFGGKNAPKPAPKVLELTRIGTAADHPDRSHKAIHDVAYVHLETTRSLYRRRLLINPELTGEMMVVFRITWEGVVADVTIASTTVEDKKLEQSIAAAISTWRFKPIPKADGDVTVAYPFRFNP